ncbi:rhodanese-like domain-containing protein [methane-oxidizing endosymbiont of Gigantopelta aegis]|uniref:rhodanese-like domain-containing protein n=1 Tax=methane-oxidizing endosymbiont of Gigantopelta aegis TaxID=2794938 RepID=UPI0018DD94F9|nr:rhodanese-like domain-containing protein [methane-oxidizing endosymbiont of Gigantopelta aegis]
MALTAMDLVASAKQNIQEVSIDEAKQQLDQYLILDVREPEEYSQGHLPHAINIPRGVLEFKIGAHPAFQNATDRAILVYCKTGGRSALATETLKKLGFEKAVSMAGGFDSWKDAGYDVE